MYTTLKTSEDENYTRNDRIAADTIKRFAETLKKGVTKDEKKASFAEVQRHDSKVQKLTVVFEYYEVKETYSRI